MAVVAEHGSEPLPSGFVSAVFPKLNRLLMESNEGEVLRPGSEVIKWMLQHDHQQVFNWNDGNGHSGLEVCLRIIDRLLGPSIEDNSASEVGGLAAELVEKAGNERLGPFLPQLLEAVANRLATASAAAFIQSLIIVFARLSINAAGDVVDFLSQIQINGESGLQVVLSKWTENSVSFAGYDEIRQKSVTARSSYQGKPANFLSVIALSKLYELNDARLQQTMVKGDLIVQDDGRIKTRSRAKQSMFPDFPIFLSHDSSLAAIYKKYAAEKLQADKRISNPDPDQYTVIPATLKIVKVLIEELISASGAKAAANAAALAAASGELDSDDDDDGGWEDDDDTLDLSLGSTKLDLMSFIEGGARQKDDETQSYLTDFFIRCGRENVANFQEWYNMLSQEEKDKLNDVANSSGQ